MKEKFISDIESQMQKILDNSQLEKLHQVLACCLHGYEISDSNPQEKEADFIEMFLAAKRIEGRSEKSLKYYKATILKLVETVGKTVRYIATDDIRSYLSGYQTEHNSSTTNNK